MLRQDQDSNDQDLKPGEIQDSNDQDQVQGEQTYLEEVVIKPRYRSDLLVVQANELVRSKQDPLSLLEAKIVRLAIAQVLKNETDFRTYEIDIISLAKLLKMDKYNCYHEMDAITTSLMKKLIYIKSPGKPGKKDNYVKLHWVDTIIYKDGILTFKLSETLKPYLISLKELFTSFEYEEVIQLPTFYSIRLYELLASYQNIRFNEERQGIYKNSKIRVYDVDLDQNEVIFPISYLREFFICEDKYKGNNTIFIQKIIEKNMDYINRYTYMKLKYRVIKDVRGRINYIVFKYLTSDECEKELHCNLFTVENRK